MNEIPKPQVGRKPSYDFTPLLNGQTVVFPYVENKNNSIIQCAYLFAKKRGIKVKCRTDKKSELQTLTVYSVK